MVRWRGAGEGWDGGARRLLKGRAARGSEHHFGTISYTSVRPTSLF